jgi:hypothetical protein
VGGGDECGGSSSSMPKEVLVLDRGVMKRAKDCTQCSRQMTWRKKWEKDWENTRCSLWMRCGFCR